MKPSQAAELLSVPVDEIRSVDDSPAGTVITTTDGVTYINVPEDTPDGAGRAGLMVLNPPSRPASYAIPTFVQPVDAEPVVERVQEVTGAPLADATASPAPTTAIDADEITSKNLPAGCQNLGKGRYALPDGTEVKGIKAVRDHYANMAEEQS